MCVSGYVQCNQTELIGVQKKNKAVCHVYSQPVHWFICLQVVDFYIVKHLQDANWNTSEVYSLVFQCIVLVEAFFYCICWQYLERLKELAQTITCILYMYVMCFWGFKKMRYGQEYSTYSSVLSRVSEGFAIFQWSLNTIKSQILEINLISFCKAF